MRVFTQVGKVVGVGDPAVADLSTTVVRVAKVGSIIIAHPDLSMITHAERLDSVSAGCRHRHCWPSTAFSKAHDQIFNGDQVDFRLGLVALAAVAGTCQSISTGYISARKATYIS